MGQLSRLRSQAAFQMLIHKSLMNEKNLPSNHSHQKQLLNPTTLSQLDFMVANFIVNNARFYLRSGGHYMISTRAKDLNSTGHVKDLFADRNRRNEFKPIETIMLDLTDIGAYGLAVGGYRMLGEQSSAPNS